MNTAPQRFNPFPGLRPFEPEEDHLFFGREKEIDSLLGRLRTTRFLTVVGTSGSGKSSLVRSGLIPALHSGYMAGAGSSWRVAIFRPGEDPLGHLATALNHPDVLGPDDEDLTEITGVLLETTLRSSSVGLADGVRQAHIPERDNVLVVVDQFEELFRFKRRRQSENVHDEALAFVKLLLLAARQEDVKVYVVITMRSDFIGHCMEFPGLPEAVNNGLFLVPRMNRDALRRAIKGPVAVAGGEITSRLVMRLLNDIGDDPDQLPILQHALMRSWDDWQERSGSGSIDLEHYQAIGAMKHALSRHAEEAFAELGTERERTIAERLFKALTDKASDPRGVRRPSRLEEVCTLAEAEPEEVAAVVDRFRRPDRSLLMPPAGEALGAGSILDLSHESLMRVWERLVVWAREEARSAELYQRLSGAAALYEKGEAGLWRDPELQLGLLWREDNAPSRAWAQRYDPDFERAMGFLDESRQARERYLEREEKKRQSELKRARGLAITFLSLMLLAVLLGLFALKARSDAETQRDRAEEQKEKAEDHARQAEAEKEEADEARQQAEAARRAEAIQRRLAQEQTDIAISKEAAAREAEAVAEQQKDIAERKRSEAREAAEDAKQARLKAEAAQKNEEEQRKLAEDNERAAQEKEKEARELRILALARALAVEAPRLLAEGRSEFPALLAVQSHRLEHRFRERPEADPESPEVYEALRRTLSSLLPAEAYVLSAPRSAVRALAVSPDARTLAFGGEGGEVARLDLDWPRVELARLDLLESRVRSLAFSPDGQRLAVGSFDGEIRTWDLEQPDVPARTFSGHTDSVNSLAFHPRGTPLASASSDGGVRLWDVDGNPGGQVHDGELRIMSLAFSPRGDQLAAASDSGVMLIDPDRRSEPPEAACCGRKIRSVAFSPDGQRLACGGADGTIELWKVGRPPVRQSVLSPRHDSTVNALAFNPRWDQLASASADGSVRLRDLTRLDSPPKILAEHSGWVWTLAFSPAGDLLFSGSEDRTVRIWPTRAGRLVAEICRRLTRDLSRDEWMERFGELEYAATCPGSSR